MVPEAPLEDDGAGLAPAGEGWFVLNAREAHWRDRPGRGLATPFEGAYELPQVGVRLYVLGPDEPIGMYHWEAGQEDFLVLSGEGLLLVEGEERPLRQWDFVHCPPGTKHMVVGGPCVVLGIGARGYERGGVWGGYSVDETAARHGVSVERETSDADEAYATWADVVPARYRDGTLPD
jgi:quercetin dioxygenase-like cupin family protein